MVGGSFLSEVESPSMVGGSFLSEVESRPHGWR